MTVVFTEEYFGGKIEYARAILRMLNNDNHMTEKDILFSLRKKYPDNKIIGVALKEQLDWLQDIGHHWSDELPILQNHGSDERPNWEVNKDHIKYGKIFNFHLPETYDCYDIYIDLGIDDQCNESDINKRFENRINNGLKKLDELKIINSDGEIIFPIYYIDYDYLLSAVDDDYVGKIVSKSKFYNTILLGYHTLFKKVDDINIGLNVDKEHQLAKSLTKKYLCFKGSDNVAANINSAMSCLWNIYMNMIMVWYETEAKEYGIDFRSAHKKAWKLVYTDLISAFEELKDNKLFATYLKSYGRYKDDLSKQEEIRQGKSERIISVAFYILFAGFLKAVKSSKFFGCSFYFRDKPVTDPFIDIFYDED